MDGMWRLVAIVGVLSLSACGKGDEELKAAKADAANAWAHYRELSAKVDAVDSAVSDMRTQVDRLDVEDWKTVVPDLKNQMDQVESDTGDARDASGL